MSSCKIHRFTFALLLIVCVLIGVCIGSFWVNAFAVRTLPSKGGGDKINSLFNILEEKYVDSIDATDLSEEAIVKILDKLDPHSSYIKAKDFEQVNSDLEGHFSGIGVTFNIQIDTAVVINVISGGPAERVGVLPGDRIVEINDTMHVGKGITTDDFVNRLRGKKNTDVKIGVIRSSSKEILHFNITRGDIPINSIDTYFPIVPSVGYVKISKFAANTFREYLLAFSNLKGKGCDRFIIDLRGNLGGYLEAAVQMINELLPDDRLIVYTEGKSSPRTEAKSNGRGSFQSTPIVVLIDEWSASASEIFAGAIQDNDRGLVIGRRSFGKGLVQQQFSFEDGSAVRLTVARYYIPSGRCIQKKYSPGHGEEYELDLLNRYARGEFFSKDSIRNIDTTRYFTHSGRVVYGGAGIMPDIFIPRDTSSYSAYYNKLMNQSVFYQFCFRYAEQHKQALSAKQNAEEVCQYLENKDVLTQFIEHASQKGIEKNEKELQRSQELLKDQLYACIARNVKDEDMFYQIYLQHDPTIIRAIEEILKENLTENVK